VLCGFEDWVLRSLDKFQIGMNSESADDHSLAESKL
jgi:hypothetical protein